MIPQFLQLGEDAEKVVRAVRQSLVIVETSGGHGAGVIWPRTARLVVTNDHVAGRSDRAMVSTGSGERVRGRVTARDRFNDLALIQVDEGLSERTEIEIRDDRTVAAGEIVIAVGHPLGVVGSAAMGIVSRSQGSWRISRGKNEREVLQADIQLAPGNSGGPLVDARGRLVGLAAMVVGPGIGIAVPSHIVQRFVEAELGACRKAA